MRKYWFWYVAATIAVVGAWASQAAAGQMAADDRERSAASFDRAAADIASTLDTALSRQEDLVAAASGFVVENPDPTNAEFHRWAATVGLADRHPEVEGIGLVTIVPHQQLATYAAAAEANPSGPLAADGTFEVTPPGERSEYCFVRATGLSQPGLAALPAGLDLCATEIGASILASRDSGHGSYRPGPSIDGDAPEFIVYTPVYADGTVPVTTVERRTTYLGTIGTQINAEALLDGALGDHSGVSATLTFERAGSRISFSSTTGPRGHATWSRELGRGWTLEVTGRASAGGLAANDRALALLAAGLIISTLLAALVLVLGTSRARAMRMVAATTVELRHQALHDTLTDLPNRALIVDRAERMLARNRRNTTVGAALFIDLDDFKTINDSLGHAVGDELLVAVASRLRSCLRDVDTIGRMGGDEFVVLIDDAILDSGPELVAERLLMVMQQPFELPSAPSPVRMSVSIGVASGPRESAGDLLRDADLALYQAKDAGRNQHATFDTGMETTIRRRVELEFEVRGALDRGELRLAYQPIHRLDDMKLIGVEALLRWDHPVLGAVGPDEFIPIMEQSGQIMTVGRWVLDTACRQVAAWRDDGHDIAVSVNVSARQLDHDGIVEDVRRALRDSGLLATALTIEVTETSLMRDPRITAQRLEAIKALGTDIAVDDFGTGYSSLAYLRQFPVDSLKIDRAFTQAVTESPEGLALINSLVQLGRGLGLRTLAEGVETGDQAAELRAQHVDEAQGYLFARPMAPEVLESTFLAEQPASTLAG